MRLDELHGSRIVENEEQLLERLRTARSGEFGAFGLSREPTYPSLFVHLCDDFAYVHYFPNEQHPGYQPTGMTPADAPPSVRFLMIGESPIEMPAESLCSADVAYQAALEFFRLPAMPRCISWFEL